MYKYHCENLNGPLADHYATTYGITHDSILNSCNYFHVTNGFVPDIMHIIILEGSLELCMRHLLINSIHTQKLFSLETLNNWIKSFKYGTWVASKPSTIASTHISKNGHLKQSGKLYFNMYATINYKLCTQRHKCGALDGIYHNSLVA